MTVEGVGEEKEVEGEAISPSEREGRGGDCKLDKIEIQ